MIANHYKTTTYHPGLILQYTRVLLPIKPFHSLRTLLALQANELHNIYFSSYVLKSHTLRLY